MPLCIIILYYITLHYITLHYITLHYITLHYITLHYITLYYAMLCYVMLCLLCVVCYVLCYVIHLSRCLSTKAANLCVLLPTMTMVFPLSARSTVALCIPKAT